MCGAIRRRPRVVFFIGSPRIAGQDVRVESQSFTRGSRRMQDLLPLASLLNGLVGLPVFLDFLVLRRVTLFGRGAARFARATAAG